jgi:hypothetical protein
MSRNPTHLERPSGAWINFSYISFGASMLMVGGGIFALSLDWWVRAYFAMGLAMAVQSAFTLAKTVRDAHETKGMINRLEEAKTEKLLSAARA